MTGFGSDDRTIRELAMKLINASSLEHGVIAEGTMLCKLTVTKLADGITLNRQGEIIKRLFRYFEEKFNGEFVKLNPPFMSVPKETPILEAESFHWK